MKTPAPGYDPARLISGEEGETMLGHRSLKPLLAGAVAAVLAWPAAGYGASPTVIATGLDNPRGLALDGGAVYVAEAGRGGSGPCGIAAGGDTVCYGATGAVTRLANGSQTRIVEGLPSVAPPGGVSATGPHDVAVGRSGLDVLLGFGGSPAQRAVFGPGASLLGQLVRVKRDRVAPVADLLAYEAAANPDGRQVESNGYGLVARPGGRYVADAGGNDLVKIGGSGLGGPTSTVAVFPNRLALAPPFLGLPPGATIPMEPVPDAVTFGPDGALYVGELTGFPFPVGAARVYRIVPGKAPTIFADGFTNIIDIAFGPDGSLYVLEISASGLLGGLDGALIRVAPNGTRTTIASTGLVAPTSVAVADNGTIYVSNFGIFPGAGQVLAFS
jgi:hypothetical protein